MSYSKLVFTVLRGSDEKFEIYGKGENAPVERIIHYKLKDRMGSLSDDDAFLREWVVVDTHRRIPPEFQNQSAVNFLWHLSE